MDYHSDRFQDSSLLVYKDDDIYALLPANRVDRIVYSHQGLTYGGLLLSPKAKLEETTAAFRAVLQYLNQAGVNYLNVKIIPSFYNLYPSDELQYFAYLTEAMLVGRDLIMLIDLRRQLGFQKNRREGINKARRNGLEVREVDDFHDFWNQILIPNLDQKHGARPVHSLEEIELLASRFPERIRQVNVYKGQELVAGTTLFLTQTTIHPQYVSANPDKNVLGSLDLLYDHIIREYADGRDYFDFNTSSEQGGKVLNPGLIFWKETCGARPHTIDNYLIETASFNRLTLPLK